METGKTDFGKSAGLVIIKDGKVLLGRHTYGEGNGLLIIPGGYINEGESPEDTAIRETMEETGVTARVTGLLGIRTNATDWYLIFKGEYINGKGDALDEENSEVIWLDVASALQRDDVPDLTKHAIQAALYDNCFSKKDYKCVKERGKYLYFDGRSVE